MTLKKLALFTAVVSLGLFLKPTSAMADDCPCDGVCYTLDGCDQTYVNPLDIANCYGEVMAEAIAACFNQD